MRKHETNPRVGRGSRRHITTHVLFFFFFFLSLDRHVAPLLVCFDRSLPAPMAYLLPGCGVSLRPMRFFDPIARSALIDGSALRLFPTSSSSSSSSVLAEYPADDAETSSRADRDSAAARCARMYAVDPGSGGRFALMYAVDPGSGGGGIGGERSSPGGGVASASASPSADSLEGPRSRSTSSNFTRDALSRGLETGSGGGGRVRDRSPHARGARRRRPREATTNRASAAAARTRRSR